MLRRGRGEVERLFAEHRLAGRAGPDKIGWVGRSSCAHDAFTLGGERLHPAWTRGAVSSGGRPLAARGRIDDELQPRIVKDGDGPAGLADAAPHHLGNKDTS